jgi:hypothetical protein
MVKTITHVINFATAQGGHSIEVEVEFADTGREWLRCEPHTAPNLVRALMQAATIAEQHRKASPKQPLQLEMPFRATDVTVGVAVDGSHLAMKFPTAEGVPLVVAIPPALAQKAIEHLSVTLEGIGRQPPPHKN